MSRENVEIVRRIYGLGSDLLNDSDAVDRAFRDYLDESFELHTPPEYPEGGQVYRGRDGSDQFRDMLRQAWSKWLVEPERFLDAGEHVVVLVRIQGAGGASGLQIGHSPAHLWTVRGGRASSMQVFMDPAQALEAAGLREGS
ncbi:MAG: nuclear transport factor 2 family protein [Solirubrobacteraceae bacterium]